MYALLVVVGLVAGAVSAPVDPVQATFNQLDTNHHGYLTVGDFIRYCKIFDNGDGHIKLPEFIATSHLPSTQAIPAFNTYDVNHDGDITLSDVHSLFTSFDDNHDGKVTSAEFATHFAQMLLQMAVGK